MKMKKKRLLGILLTLALVLGLMPGMSLTAYADGHTHSFTYSADGATITATCNSAGCNLTDNKVTLTIVPNPVLYYNDGQPKEASLEGLEAFNAATGKNISTDNIAYYKGDTNVTAQIKAGSGTSIKGATYTARLDVEGKRATVTFRLTAKPTPHTHVFTYSAEGNVITATCTQNASNMEACDLTNKQATLTLNAPLRTTYDDGKDATATLTGEIPGVNPTIHYSKGSVTLSSAPTDAGTYTAWCQLGNATARVEYTIAKATNPGWTTLPQAKANLVYIGEPLELITAGTASAGNALYTAGTDPDNEPDVYAGGMPYTGAVPQMTNAGTYYVWCKIDGGKNYTSINAQNVEVTIAKANPTATAPSGSATYGQTLADVTLTNPEGNTPGTWAWVDSTTSVGSVGNNTFRANFTPTDTTNYNSVSDVEVTVTVGKAASAAATVAANNFTYDAAEHPLVTVTGEATGGAMRYALGTDATTAPASGWSASVPTATDAGTYFVWYKVQGDDDHFDVEAACVTVTVTTIVVSFAENGGSEVDDQIVPKGGKAVRPEDPTRLGYDFVDWYADEGCTEVFDFETVIEQNTVVYALWKSVAFPETLTLAQDYLLLLPDDTFQLEVIDAPRAWLASIAWSSDNEAVATVDDKGTVTAVSEGVAWIMATLDPDSSSLTALCRIDVTAEYPEVTAVRLVDTKATAELYSTDYTRIEVLPELLQNHTADGHAAADKNLPAIAGTTAIENARFADAATAEAFDLRVVDDRTLEIVPKDEFVQGDAAKLKTLKSSYKSAVIVTIDGQEFTTPEMIRLSVKMTKPRITAKIKAFNSFIPGDTQAFVFSGGVPEIVEVVSAPEWLSVDTDALTAAYMGAVDLKLKDKVILNVKPKGWAFTTQVTVNVTVAKTAPKFSLSPSTVRLKPGVDALASANAVLGNADPALQEIAVLNVMEGKTNAEGALDVTVEGGVVTVRPGKEAPTDGKAHTYKVTLALLRNGMPTDATRTLTVRLLEESREVSVTAKAAGAIDPAIPESPVTVTLTAKNANAASVNVTEVTVAAAAGTAAPQDVTDRFDIEIDGLTVTFRQAGGAALDTSLTYTATIRTNVGAAATVKLTVKTNANPKPTVTLKAAGAIDVIRPDSAVTVTHKVKDCFTYAPALEDLRIWKVTKVNGKRTYEPADDKFDVRMENGAYVLTLKPGTKVDHTKDKFAVSLSGALDGTPFETAKTDITVKLGSARIKQSTKSVTLLKDDRNSRGSVTITVTTAGVNGIDWDKTLSAISIPKGKDGKPLFEVERIGQDIVIRFANSELKEFKSAKVKVSVFLLGNNSTKPNKTLSISVKLG